MTDKRNPPRPNTKNRTKYVITSGPWKGTVVTPLSNTDRPGIVLATDDQGRYIQIETANLAPEPRKREATQVGQKAKQ